MEKKKCGNCEKCKCNDKTTKDENIPVQDIQPTDGENRKLSERGNFNVVVERGGPNSGEVRSVSEE